MTDHNETHHEGSELQGMTFMIVIIVGLMLTGLFMFTLTAAVAN